jgi:hypothetical protein
MFRTLIYPSSGACGCVDELPHRSSCSQFVVCWSFCCGWYLVVFVVLQPAKRTPPNISRSKNSNTQRIENKTTDVAIHQHSRRLLKMDILMSETYWAHNKWNKITSDIKLVFHSSTIAMMRGPINIRSHRFSSAFSCFDLHSTWNLCWTILSKRLLSQFDAGMMRTNRLALPSNQMAM